MKLSDIIPSDEQLKLVQGVEGELLRRKRTGTISGIVALAVAVLQILIAAVEKDYLTNVGKFFNNLINLRLDELIGLEGLPIPQLTGMLVLGISVGTYLLFRWSSVLLKESEEPFRYTFWIEPFEPVKDTPGTRFVLEKDDQFHLLHHDLMERLKTRIHRLSLLDELQVEAQEALRSHIHIRGHYAIREEKNSEWVIHVMPRIRIGPPSMPEALADPVKYPLYKPVTNDSLANPISKKDLDAEKYNQIVERVYSRIATEIYKQILSDVKGKINMFPTSYLRASALFHEAKDFERSNTVDAYDYAIELYRESKRYFDMRAFRGASKFLSNIPLLWRLVIKSQLMEARARIGYSRCLIYRRGISALSGRSQNTLFEIPEELEKKTISNLIRLYNRINYLKWRIKPADEEHHKQYKTLMASLTYPSDSFLRRDRSTFDRLRKSLFDAYAVAALAYSYLGAGKKAEKFRDSAKATDPALSQEHALWLLAAAEIETGINQKLLLFRQATEVAPNFEYAQYRLAQYSEMRLRIRNEIKKERVKSVLEEYDSVLKINPGNIGAYAAKGYLFWLLGDLEEAKKKFEEGCEIKATISQTFVGDLSYGLARIAAEKGEFNTSYNLYIQAISADPVVAAYSTTPGSMVNSSYYDYIAPDMRDRYIDFRKNVEDKIANAVRGNGISEKVSEKIFNAVHSFVLNDCGCACLNYFHRFGDNRMLEAAINAFEEAISRDRENTAAYYNLSNAYVWRNQQEDNNKILKCLKEAEKLARTWRDVLIASAQSQARQIWNELKDSIDELPKKNKELEETKQELENLNTGYQNAQARVQQGTQVRIQDLEKMIKDLNNEIKELSSNIEKLPGKLQENFKKIDDIMDQTTFISLYEGLNLNYKGKGVSEFCALNIDRDKLNEKDIEAIGAWALLLSTNDDIISALKASEKLCLYIQNYNYTENFDIDMILYGIYTNLQRKPKRISLPLASSIYKPLEEALSRIYEPLEKQRYISFLFSSAMNIYEQLEKLSSARSIYEYIERRQIELYSEKKDACTKRIREIIEKWLERDPIRYVSLKWATETNFFNPEEHIKFLTNAIEQEPGNDIYYSMLGAVYSKQSNYLKAVDSYKEATRIDPKNIGHHASLALAYRMLNEWEKAADVYYNLLKIEPDNENHRKDLNWLLKDGGDYYFYKDDYQKAIEKYTEAINIDPNDTEIRSKLIKARCVLRCGKKALDMIPVLTPIPVQVARNLVPYVATEDRKGLLPALNTKIEGMREKISKTMGVRVPGIRFREELTLTDGVYKIQINEIPYSAGFIPAEKRLFTGSIENLEAMGVVGEETINPKTGEKAFWIYSKDRERVEKSRLWEIDEYMVRHIEVVILKNLNEFFGHQEVMNMLIDKIPDAGEKPEYLSDLTIVLKSLLKEEVPITAFKEIVEKFNLLRKEGADIFTMVETIRSLDEIRPKLPGNNSSFSFYRLGRLFEKELSNLISKKDKQQVLIMKQQELQYALSIVQEKMGSLRQVAILVENEELRPFVRRLIEQKLAEVPVLSKRELLHDLKDKIVGEIELTEPIRVSQPQS